MNTAWPLSHFRNSSLNHSREIPFLKLWEFSFTNNYIYVICTELCQQNGGVDSFKPISFQRNIEKVPETQNLKTKVYNNQQNIKEKEKTESSVAFLFALGKTLSDALHPDAHDVDNVIDSAYPVMSADWKLDVLKEQVLTSVARIDEYRGILHVRRHLAASPLFKGIPNFKQMRIAMLRAETTEELFSIMEQTRPLLNEVEALNDTNDLTI